MNAALQHETLTRSVEDYLKAIYRLSPRGRPAATSEIAHRLELSPASVSGMVKRLSEQGLLEHVRQVGAWADAAVVGSALVRVIAEHGQSPGLIEEVERYVRWLRS